MKGTSSVSNAGINLGDINVQFIWQ